MDGWMDSQRTRWRFVAAIMPGIDNGKGGHAALRAEGGSRRVRERERERDDRSAAKGGKEDGKFLNAGGGIYGYVTSPRNEFQRDPGRKWEILYVYAS